jgi:flagellar protein FliJ
MSRKSDVQLATVLRIREVTRDERRTLLAEAQRADEDLVSRLARLDSEQQRLQDERRRAAAPGAVDVERLVAAHRYVVGLQDRQRELQEQRRSLAVEIDRRRQSLVEADQDVRVLENLQDRRRQGYRVEEERRQAKQLDEAALQAATSPSTRGMAAALRSA